ncbi:MAG TPA: 5-formyltetrahydrofolate cyclo-ligase [Candidatus Omnitrophota bacterium]|nr:5-formyltetrahydrofolate cyclo-ligase [Candidatus Omnitrophota bacterium]
MVTSKQEIRRRIIDLLKQQKEDQRLSKSRAIAEQVLKLQEFQKAKTILFYASFAGEVDTFDLMKKALDLDKDVVLPCVLPDAQALELRRIRDLDNDLEYGPYNIQQPKKEETQRIEPARLDLVIVPGVAFDRSNNRLGRGAGYYDRFLTDLSFRIPSVGLAFDFQMIERVPIDLHDVPVNRVIFA